MDCPWFELSFATECSLGVGSEYNDPQFLPAAAYVPLFPELECLFIAMYLVSSALECHSLELIFVVERERCPF